MNLIDGPQHSPPEAIRAWGQRVYDLAHELGPIPIAGTPEWVALDDVADLERLRERRASIAVSSYRDGRGTFGRVSHAELQRRRTTYTDRPPVDPAAVRRWVATGTSTPHSAPTAATKPKGAFT